MANVTVSTMSAVFSAETLATRDYIARGKTGGLTAAASIAVTALLAFGLQKADGPKVAWADVQTLILGTTADETRNVLKKTDGAEADFWRAGKAIAAKAMRDKISLSDMGMVNDFHATVSNVVAWLGEHGVTSIDKAKIWGATGAPTIERKERSFADRATGTLAKALRENEFTALDASALGTALVGAMGDSLAAVFLKAAQDKLATMKLAKADAAMSAAAPMTGAELVQNAA